MKVKLYSLYSEKYMCQKFWKIIGHIINVTENLHIRQ